MVDGDNGGVGVGVGAVGAAHEDAAGGGAAGGVVCGEGGVADDGGLVADGLEGGADGIGAVTNKDGAGLFSQLQVNAVGAGGGHGAPVLHADGGGGLVEDGAELRDFVEEKTVRAAVEFVGYQVAAGFTLHGLSWTGQKADGRERAGLYWNVLCRPVTSMESWCCLQSKGMEPCSRAARKALSFPFPRDSTPSPFVNLSGNCLQRLTTISTHSGEKEGLEAMFGLKKADEQQEKDSPELSRKDRRRLRRIEKKADKKAAKAERKAQKKIDRLNAKADKKTSQLEKKAKADAKSAKKADKKAEKKATKKADRVKAAENMTDAELDKIADDMVSGISKVSPAAGKVAKQAAHSKTSRSFIRTMQKRGGKATQIIAALAPTIIPLVYAGAGVLVTALKNRKK